MGGEHCSNQCALSAPHILYGEGIAKGKTEVMLKNCKGLMAIVFCVIIFFALFSKARTRHLNSGRSRIISLQKFKDNPSKTAPVPSIMKPSLNENTVLQKLPLPRYSTVGTLQNHSSLQSSCINRTLLSTTCSGGNKDLTGCQTSNSRQSSGCSFPAVNPLMIPCTSQVTITPNSLAPSHNFNKHINKEQSSTYSVCDLTNSSALCSDGDFSHSAGEHSSSQTAPNLIIVNNEARREYHEAPTVLEQCSSLDSGQNDLARSPKRKG